MDACVQLEMCPKVVTPKWHRVSQARFGSQLQQEPVPCKYATDQYLDGIRLTTAVDPTAFPLFALAGDAEASFAKVGGTPSRDPSPGCTTGTSAATPA